MIILDANILVIDLGYPGDANFPANSRFLAHLYTNQIPRGMVMQGLLEVVGKQSFNTSAGIIPNLPVILRNKYGLTIYPDVAVVPEYAECTYTDILSQMVRKMSLGDAVMAVQIANFAPTASALITWDAARFHGKIVIPVLTPAEWLAQQVP